MKTALKTLQKMDFADKARRYPGVPRTAIPSTRFNDHTANALTRAILRWLELHGHYATRINTMGRQLKGTTVIDVIGRAHVTPSKWIPGTTRKGTADIHASINGRHVSIEVKIGSDTMSPEQLKTKNMVEQSGGLFYAAKDFESFYKWYNTLKK